jgi:hypothetical protein
MRLSIYMRINPEEIETWNEATVSRLLMYWDVNRSARKHIALSAKVPIGSVPEIIF